MTLPPPALPLDHLALRGAPGDIALVVNKRAIDYATFDRHVGALAGALLREGAAAGDRIASWLPKTLTAALLPLACARAGLVHVPVNPLLKAVQVEHILGDSAATLLIASAARAATLPPTAAKLLIEEDSADALLAGDPLPPSQADPDGLTQILYTSGSTGRPKGVMLSHRNLWLGAEAVATYLELGPTDRVLAVLPLSFDAGQSQLLSTWHAGGTAVLLDYLLPRDVVKAVARHGITGLAGVPPFWVQLTEAGWPDEAAKNLRYLTNTGGRLPVPLVRRLRSIFPDARLYLMYGLTEAFRSTYLQPALVDRYPDSIGTAIPHAEVLVLRPDGDLTSDGEPGELVHAGPLVAQGYWRDAERSAERFRPAPAVSSLGGMAVWSGDTVVRDATGLLRFVGRDDEMIKTAGNRVSPTELEEAAIASGGMAEAVALGAPDERLGQEIWLVGRAAAPLDVAQAEERLSDYLRTTLPNFMQPRRVLWRDSLPRGPNGKLDRAAIRQELLS